MQISKRRKKTINRKIKEAKKINDLIIESTKKLENGNFSSKKFIAKNPNFINEVFDDMGVILKEMSDELNLPKLSVFFDNKSDSLIKEAEGFLNN